MIVGSARKMAKLIRERYPGTDISETMLRRWMDSGDLPSMNSGVKRVTSDVAIEKLLFERLGGGKAE